jgi:innexin
LKIQSVKEKKNANRFACSMAGFLVDAAAKVGHHSHDSACDDDFYDRLSRRYSVILLIIFTILVSTKQYVGEPIACFCPAHFTGTHVEYTNNICWISNTYFVSFDRLLPKYPDPKTERFIYFYQYVPLILIIQAILFYIPSIIWSSLNSKSGYDLAMLVNHARLIDTYTSELRETSVRHLARFIDRTLEYHRQKRLEYMDELKSMTCSSPTSICSFFLMNNHMRMRDHHLMWSFLFSKVLYLLNVLGQLYVLNFFLGNDYHMYGFSVIRALFTGNNENWTVTPRFPRVTW